MSFNGILLVDKPGGCTSHDVVQQARKVFKTRSVGHAGTLDPMATGLLILLIGEGTKLSNFFLEGDKGYTVQIRLGLETDTQDITGKILKETPVNLQELQIRDIVGKMQGELELPVPAYSAVKVQGKKLYEEAREGRNPITPMRKMNFFDVKLIEVGPTSFVVELRCSKGSYVRSWAHALGQHLGVGAVVEKLRRTWSQPYSVEKAISLDLPADEIAKSEAAIAMTEALPHWPAIYVDGMDHSLLANGQISRGLVARLRPLMRAQSFDGVRAISSQDRSLVALLVPDREREILTIGRVFSRLQ